MKISKWQHELARYYKRGKLVSYFLNNAAKTCLYGLKILENIQIGHFFQPRTFFHLSSNLHTSCFSAFNQLKTCQIFLLMLRVSSEKFEEAYSLVSLIFSFSVFRSVFEKLVWFSIKNKKINAFSFTKKINVGKWMLKYTLIH